MSDYDYFDYTEANKIKPEDTKTAAKYFFGFLLAAALLALGFWLNADLTFFVLFGAGALVLLYCLFRLVESVVVKIRVERERVEWWVERNKKRQEESERLDKIAKERLKKMSGEV